MSKGVTDPMLGPLNVVAAIARASTCGWDLAVAVFPDRRKIDVWLRRVGDNDIMIPICDMNFVVIDCRAIPLKARERALLIKYRALIRKDHEVHVCCAY